jgi:hypothetical protein
MSLEKHIADHVSCGCRHADRMLGIQKMPPGYALMLDADELYFYWLCQDGTTSDIHWNKWAVRKGAMARLTESERA